MEAAEGLRADLAARDNADAALRLEVERLRVRTCHMAICFAARCPKTSHMFWKRMCGTLLGRTHGELQIALLGISLRSVVLP